MCWRRRWPSTRWEPSGGLRHLAFERPEQFGRWRVARAVFPADEPAPGGSRNRAGTGRDEY
jgi:hypothetical protein